MHKLIKFIIVLFSCTTLLQSSYAQTGLWQIKSVVSEAEEKPAALWFHFHEDGSYESGIGWTQLFAGSYNVDPSGKKMSLQEGGTGLSTWTGDYEFEMEGEKMIWQQAKYGLITFIELERIESLPRAPSDKVQGLWAYEKIVMNGVDVSGSNGTKGKFVLLLPDRKYMAQYGPSDADTGHWHMDDDKRILTMLPEDRSKEVKIWELKFEGEKMIWSGKSASNKNLSITYKVINQLPG